MTQKSFEIEFELSMDSCMFNKLIGNKAHEVGDNCFLDDCIMKRASLCKENITNTGYSLMYSCEIRVLVLMGS